MTIALERREPRRNWPAFARLLLSVIILAASATLLTGTLANLSATTINPNSGFAAGELILSNQVGVQKPCTSSGDLVSCDALFPGYTKPGVAYTALVTLQNVGSVPAATFVLYSTNCSDQPLATPSSSSVLCSETQLGVHDDMHDYCYYPTAGSGACHLSSSGTLADFVKQHPQATPLSLSPDGIGAGIQYSITVLVPGDVDNTYQGRTANVDFDWEVTT